MISNNHLKNSAQYITTEASRGAGEMRCGFNFHSKKRSSI